MSLLNRLFMLRKILIFSIAIMMFNSTSCKKHDHHVDTSKQHQTNINIISPEEGKVYVKGDTIHIDAQITSSGGIHGYSVAILLPNGAALYSIEEHAHDTEVIIDRYWVYNTDILPIMDLKLVIKAIITHEGETVQMQKNISIK